MSNHLSHETSPYLLQRAENPVDWYPWGGDALTRSRSENKPIFLSIGYSACHWCHVMAEESFEDLDTAALLNSNFISIKVDREERPDLDSIYMKATTALTGSGGWPMSVFLTPELKPFYAGTYFPPVRRYNLPSFKEVLLSLVRMWAEDPSEVLRVAGQVTAHIQPKPDGSHPTAPSPDLLEAATSSLLDSYDWGNGGWGNTPKFPQPMSIEFILRRAIAGGAGHDEALKAALHALKAMARGGMYDVVGGGFARYSTDNSWHVPHFEKMLYDNALLGRVYLHAWQITREPFYKLIATETLDFVGRELTHPDGGFYSSLDADSAGKEGAFYEWTVDQIRQALSQEDDIEFFFTAYGLTDNTLQHDGIVLQRALDNGTLASRFRIDQEVVATRLAHCHQQLLRARETRSRPATDDKILTAWNGLMLQTLAEASRALDDKVRTVHYHEMATRNAEFLTSSLRSFGELRRGRRDGRVTQGVFLEDFGGLTLGLLELYQTDFDNRWLTVAQELADEVLARFSDARGGFFDTPDNGEALLVRPKDLEDNATPCGNSLACQALLRLAAFTDKGEYRDRAELALRLVVDSALRFPTSFANWLSAADEARDDGRQIAVLFGQANDLGADALLDVIRSAYRPNVVVAASTYPPPTEAPPLLQHRSLTDGKATAYVCEHFVCRQPVTSPHELLKML